MYEQCSWTSSFIGSLIGSRIKLDYLAQDWARIGSRTDKFEPRSNKFWKLGSWKINELEFEQAKLSSACLHP